MWAKSHKLYLRRGDRFTTDLPPAGSLASRTALIWTVKRQISEVDSQALWKVTELGGLLVINQAPAATPGWGVITVLDELNGIVRVQLEAPATLFLTAPRMVEWDLQVEYSPLNVQTLFSGRIKLVADVTREVSTV